MAARTAQGDAAEDEDHPGDPGNVSEVLLDAVPGRVVPRGSEVDDEVADERGGHDGQAEPSKPRDRRELPTDALCHL